ncbi:MAG: hypothetical protein HY744_21100 [Deltaproteobacteria bacterium]|nr:hypothetical protein [Deltaproteobacteria bacterium]
MSSRRTTVVVGALALLVAGCAQPAEPPPEQAELTGMASARIEAAGPSIDYEPRPRFPVEPEPGPAGVRLWLEPMDGSTAVDAHVLRVGLDGGEAGVGGAMLAQLASLVSLRTWPELEPVPAAVRQRAAGQGDDPRAYVELEPAPALADRWYVLRVGQPPAGAIWPRYAWRHELGGGASGARFRPGSDPKVRQVQLCDEPGSTALVIDFTERLAKSLPAGTFATVRQAGTPASCESRLMSRPEDPSFGQLYLRCQKLADHEAVELLIHPQATSMSGRSVADWAGQAGPGFSFVPAELPSWGKGCRAFRP